MVALVDNDLGDVGVDDEPHMGSAASPMLLPKTKHVVSTLY